MMWLYKFSKISDRYLLFRKKILYTIIIYFKDNSASNKFLKLNNAYMEI